MYMPKVPKGWWKSIPAILLYIAGLLSATVYFVQNVEQLCKTINTCNVFIFTLRESTEEEIDVWREIAQTQYDQGDYELAKELLDIAILKTAHGDWTLYRLRAKSSKRLNMYKDSIRDYQKVIELNPRRERSHLSPIESYICLRDYNGAREWIDKYYGTLHEEYIKTFFMFFDLISEMLLSKNYESSYDNYREHITRNPIGFFYRKRFWSFDRTKACVEEATVSDKIKIDALEVIWLTENTSKLPIRK